MITTIILGAGVMQIPAIKAAKAMNWKVIAVDADSRAPGIELADDFLPVDLKDPQGIIKAVKESSHNPDTVFTAGTDFSYSVAVVAQGLNLPGLLPETALKASDKIVMRQAFLEHHVPQPDFRELTPQSCLAEAVKGMDFPLVVKPVDNMGGRGVKKVESLELMDEAVNLAMKTSRSSRVILEEFMDGREFSLDALVYQGKITICGFADRHIYYPPYFIEMGHTIPAKVSPEEYKEVVDVFTMGIKALGINNGAAKGDMMLTSKGAMVGEIAARLSGGYMSGWTYPYSSGINLSQAGLRISAGMDPEISAPLWEKTTAERAFVSAPGQVKEILGQEEASQISGVKDIFLRIKPGDHVDFPINNVEKCGNIIAVAEERDQAVSSALQAAALIIPVLDPLNESSRAFLFNGENNLVPNCFSSVETDRFSIFIPKKNKPIGYSDIFIDIERQSNSSVDWQGRSFNQALEQLLSLRSVNEKSPLNKENYTTYPSDFFLKPFLRGSVQGGLWLLDRLIIMVNNNQNPLELLY